MFGLSQSAKRSLSSVIASLFLMGAPALAVAAQAPPSPAAAPAKSKAQAPAKGKTSAKGDKTTPKSAKKAPSKSAKASKTKAPKAASAQSKTSKTKKATKAAKTTKAKKTPKRADSKAPGATRRACDQVKIAVDRAGLERETVPLTTCSGLPLASAQQRLSVLARPWSAPRPSSKDLADAHEAGEEIAEGVRLLDEGLVRRLVAVAKRFPDATVSLVSGYRPNSRSEKHESGRALDVRLVDGSTAELAAFCRTLPNTGCGYYPNSMFVHIDVRDAKEGSASWIDASGPGEPSQFVSEWPPRPSAP